MPNQKNNQIKLRAYAKLNLSLKITGKRPDGYHDIDSIMQSISLHDEIDIKPADKGIKITCSVPEIEDNIAQKAAELFLNETKINGGVVINIKKNIPLAAGLGGGSADAAAVLVGLNNLFNANLHKDKLFDIGTMIGSDVPFCLLGGTAICTGRGERVERTNPRSGAGFVLVIPRIQISTKDVYAKYDKIGKGASENELELASVTLFPELGRIKGSLGSLTGQQWKMSGSGPALFLEIRDLSEAEKYFSVAEKLNADCHVVKRMDCGAEIIR